MHSRIFQVSREPIVKDDYITEDRYFEGFCDTIADYVDGDTDRNEDIAWLKNVLKDVATFDDDKECFTIVNKLEYFKNSYNQYMQLMKYLSDMTLEQFAGLVPLETTEGQPYSNLSTAVFALDNTYNDKYSFYMDDNGEYYGNQTLDNFMRNTKEGDTWYLGSTIDYHA